MALRPPPLLQKNHKEQSRHGKVDAGEVQRQAAGKGAQQAARRPVELVQQGHQEHGAVFVHPGGHLIHAAEHGIGLVGEGEDHVGALFAHGAEALDEGKPVEQMPRVDEQAHQRHGGQSRGRGQKARQHELQAARVDKAAEGQGPQRPEPRLPQQDAEGCAQKHIAEQHPQRLAEGKPGGLPPVRLHEQHLTQKR